MRAGELRERFAFYRRKPLTEPGDGYGTTEGEWLLVFRCRARTIPLRRGETVQAARLSGVQPMILTVRSTMWTRDVATDWRAEDVLTGKTYNIRTVEPDPKGASIDMLIEAGVPSDG